MDILLLLLNVSPMQASEPSIYPTATQTCSSISTDYYKQVIQSVHMYYILCKWPITNSVYCCWPLTPAKHVICRAIISYLYCNRAAIVFTTGKSICSTQQSCVNVKEVHNTLLCRRNSCSVITIIQSLLRKGDKGILPPIWAWGK